MALLSVTEGESVAPLLSISKGRVAGKRGAGVKAQRSDCKSRIEQFGVVLGEYGTQRGGGALFHPVDCLNQSIDVGSHDQQIASSERAGIPIRVRSSTRHEHGRTRVSLDFLIANANAEGAFEHIPRFIVVAMKMGRGDETGLARGTTRIAPFGDDKGIVNRADDLSGERRGDSRRIHMRASSKKVKFGYT